MLGMSCRSDILSVWKEFCKLHFEKQAHDKNEASTNFYHKQSALDTDWYFILEPYQDNTNNWQVLQHQGKLTVEFLLGFQTALRYNLQGHNPIFSELSKGYREKNMHTTSQHLLTFSYSEVVKLILVRSTHQSDSN